MLAHGAYGRPDKRWSRSTQPAHASEGLSECGVARMVEFGGQGGCGGINHHPARQWGQTWSTGVGCGRMRARIDTTGRQQSSAHRSEVDNEAIRALLGARWQRAAFPCIRMPVTLSKSMRLVERRDWYGQGLGHGGIPHLVLLHEGSCGHARVDTAPTAAQSGRSA